ncbi:MAG TPA: YtxH domain-containing protein [Candidatus Sulfotelmatobacter sp.]|nr:YtxH domain-containing protein [Candidatus Sulfotelmatobacter sp.]
MSITRFLLGVGLGVGVGMLIAPTSGQETRERLGQKARDLMETPQRKIEEKIEQTAESAKETAGDVGEKVGRQAAEAAVEAVRQSLANRNKSA